MGGSARAHPATQPLRLSLRQRAELDIDEAYTWYAVAEYPPVIIVQIAAIPQVNTDDLLGIKPPKKAAKAEEPRKGRITASLSDRARIR